MFKMTFNAPSKRDLTKLVMDAAEKQIAEKARRAAAPYGGVRVRFSHKADGSLGSVQFEGSDTAVGAARKAIAG